MIIIALSLLCAASDTPTLSAVQAELAALPAANISTFQRDHDARISDVETLAALAARPDWFRRHQSAHFTRIDTNHDNGLDVDELRALVPAKGSQLQIAERRQRSVRQAQGANVPMPGTGMGVGRAHIFVGQQQSYIADYNVVNGQYDPVIGILNTGTVLDVGPITITIIKRP